ncbi:MAG TPA: hypothetical protein VFS36_01640 [Chitinophagaceae bacterium]|jgi:hypothetical protein|nr:hypothetical protein [Chitinophagaceae bacterium]
MHQIFYEAEQEQRSINCRHCDWQGTSQDLIKGDYLDLIEITELFCPACQRYLGFVQHTSIAEKTAQ